MNLLTVITSERALSLKTNVHYAAPVFTQRLVLKAARVNVIYPFYHDCMIQTELIEDITWDRLLVNKSLINTAVQQDGLISNMYCN